MKKIITHALIVMTMAILGTQTNSIDQSINKRMVVNQAKKAYKIDNNDYEYPFDVENKFKGVNDKYETQSPLDDTEAEIYNIYVDGRKEKVNATTQTRSEDSLSLCSSSDDSHENNDTFETATDVYKVSNVVGLKENHSTLGGTISQKTSGWGPWKKTYIDKDFYRYDVVVTGTLEIGLEKIPSGCDYDLRLYRMANTKYASSKNMDFDVYDYISASAGNKDEHLKINVAPGTYFAVVYSFKDQTWNNDQSYRIWFEQQLDEERDETYYDIMQGRNNGDICAIWTSDYKPLGYNPLNLSSNNAKIELENYDKSPFIKSLAESNEDKDIMYSCFYVWDLGLRASLYYVFNSLLETLNDNFEEFKTLSNVSMVLTDVGFGLAAYGVETSIVSFFDASNVISSIGLAISVTSYVVSLASEIVANMINTIYSIDKMEFHKFLINACAGLEVGSGTSDREVVMVKFRYHIDTSGTKYLNCIPRYKDYGNNLYNKGFIACFDDNSPMTGTIKGFKTYAQIKENL